MDILKQKTALGMIIARLRIVFWPNETTFVMPQILSVGMSIVHIALLEFVSLTRIVITWHIMRAWVAFSEALFLRSAG